ncbi:hypothetical protein [Parafrankia sp. EAN1pec]|uniref:hypothetical protein n=1 Tax=Parafrankia sp. (strain EAN1pec) TaxID=298653 RepID=UPI0002F072E0
MPAARLGLPRSKYPDLISAGLRDGKQGYVRRTELDVASGRPGVVANTPAELVEWNKKAAARRAAGERNLVPVYEQDGVTVIGTFVVGSAEPPNLPGQRR